MQFSNLTPSTAKCREREKISNADIEVEEKLLYYFHLISCMLKTWFTNGVRHIRHLLYSDFQREVTEIICFFGLRLKWRPLGLMSYSSTRSNPRLHLSFQVILPLFCKIRNLLICYRVWTTENNNNDYYYIVNSLIESLLFMSSIDWIKIFFFSLKTRKMFLKLK